ncbi:MAG: hypothetical protein M1834_000318 [Cirrosporium novae-zelandiae]|nr:MAG: hypothetical protein M1834_000318 [Cirrosporium novae-zelandiae]
MGSYYPQYDNKYFQPRQSRWARKASDPDRIDIELPYRTRSPLRRQFSNEDTEDRNRKQAQRDSYVSSHGPPRDLSDNQGQTSLTFASQRLQYDSYRPGQNRERDRREASPAKLTQRVQKESNTNPTVSSYPPLESTRGTVKLTNIPTGPKSNVPVNASMGPKPNMPANVPTGPKSDRPNRYDRRAQEHVLNAPVTLAGHYISRNVEDTSSFTASQAPPKRVRIPKSQRNLLKKIGVDATGRPLSRPGLQPKKTSKFRQPLKNNTMELLGNSLGSISLDSNMADTPESISIAPVRSSAATPVTSQIKTRSQTKRAKEEKASKEEILSYSRPLNPGAPIFQASRAPPDLQNTLLFGVPPSFGGLQNINYNFQQMNSGFQQIQQVRAFSSRGAQFDNSSIYDASSTQASIDQNKYLKHIEDVPVPPLSGRNKSPVRSSRRIPQRMTFNKGPLPPPVPTPDYLEKASLPPQKSPIPNTLLVILDLNGTLIYRRPCSSNYFKRPFLDKFLKDIHRKGNVLMIWSSAQPDTVRRVCKTLFPNEEAKFAAIWARDKLELTRKEYMEKVQVYKRLDNIWADQSIQAKHPQSSQGKKWDQTNTVLIDDNFRKGAGQPHNLVLIEEFTKEMINNISSITKGSPRDELGRVEKFLDEVRYYEDVSSFIRKFEEDKGGKGGKEGGVLDKGEESDELEGMGGLSLEDGGVKIDSKTVVN